ncbi:hypothetical protein GSUB_17345 (plasmid) [Geoalkalibacter subterraneus]|uniref:IrrE N-terminal-like domain-containing protein n=1 Tax=Geoalkalibacter subterraneus TaxID=483547 RepID=A0A0B5FVS0_9BACT|nr:hypothetical protein GSUB_17345 [Geoalkalibacter subterraneus]
MKNVQEMQKHIESLCDKHRIEVCSHSSGGRAWRKKRRIAIRPVKSSITYAIALHEIGHILGDHQGGTRLDKEYGAWCWAKKNAATWSHTMENAMRKRLRNYIDRARNHKTAKCPENHPIFSLLEV